MIETITRDFTKEVVYILKTILLEGLIFASGASIISCSILSNSFNPGHFIFTVIGMGIMMGVLNLIFVRAALEEIPKEDRLSYNYNSYQKTRLTSTLSLVEIKAQLEVMKTPITRIKLEDDVLTFKSKNELNWFGTMNTIVKEEANNNDSYNYKLISEPATVLSFRDYGRSYIHIIKMRKLLE